jgi:hypothetical protein
MTYKEALKIMDKAHALLRLIRISLKKQIPQKLLEETKWYGNGKCPCCNAVFIDKSTNYCGNCGQALDWGDDKCSTT